MKKKLIALCLVLVFAFLPLMTSGTLAYFTDTDEAVNVMTMGKVHIEQHEQQRSFDENGALAGLVEFQQNKMLRPTTGPSQYLTYATLPNDAYKFFASADNKSLPLPIDKIVTVENKGNIDAYVRTIFAFEAPEGFDRNAHAEKKGGWALLRNDITGTQTAGSLSNTDWKWEFFDQRFYMSDGQSYVIAVATSTKALKPGETTIPSLLQYYLNQYTTQEDVEALGATVEIYAVTQAVQADGFSNIDTAFNESFGAITYDVNTGEFTNLPWDATIALPQATVVEMAEGQIDSTFVDVLSYVGNPAGKTASDFVDYGLTFGIKNPELPIHAEFKTWNADFVLTFDRDLENGGTLAQLDASYAEVNDKVVLVGHYGSIAYPCPLWGDIEANTPYRVMKAFDQVLSGYYPLSYEAVQFLVEIFDCGVMFDIPGKLSGTPTAGVDGTTVTVELRLYETLYNAETDKYEETGRSYVVASDTYTYHAN